MNEEVKRAIDRVFENSKVTEDVTRERLQEILDYVQECIDSLGGLS